MDAQDRARFIKNIYHKTEEEMALRSNERKEVYTKQLEESFMASSKSLSSLRNNVKRRGRSSKNLNDTTTNNNPHGTTSYYEGRETNLYQPAHADMSLHEYKLRETNKEKHLGPSTISSRSYVPRAFYWGGGVIDSDKTKTIREKAEVVDALDPRLGTASVVDINNRLDRPPYSIPDSTGGLRARERSKEIQPPLRFSAQTEAERINEAITNNNSMDTGPWDKNAAGGATPIWRPVTPEKWVGNIFRAISPPMQPLASNIGEPSGPSVLISEPFVVSPSSLHAAQEKAVRLRDREKSLELSGEFSSTFAQKDGWSKNPAHGYRNFEYWQDPRLSISPIVGTKSYNASVRHLYRRPRTSGATN
jgi:hypothetical protein